jgi:hypothetical protein
MTFFKFRLIFLLVPVLFPVLPGLGRAALLPLPAAAKAAVTRPVLKPAPALKKPSGG